eukprot:GSA25T00015300001.1
MYVQVSDFDQMAGLYYVLYNSVDGGVYHREPLRSEYITADDVRGALSELQAEH